MCIKSEFKEICLKLANNGRSDKGFLLTSKVCPEGVFCPCPGAIYMYKIIKNVYKIRFRRDHFETCNVWKKRKGLSVIIKIFVPNGLSVPAWDYIHMVKLEKNVNKIGLQSSLFLTQATSRQKKNNVKSGSSFIFKILQQNFNSQDRDGQNLLGKMESK